MKPLVEYTNEKYFKRLKSKNKFKAIAELASVVNNTDICTDMEKLVNALREREEIMSTGIGLGLAIPHVKIKEVKKLAFAIGISKRGIDFDSIDGQPVNLIILVAAGEKQHKDYLKLLASIMSILKNPDVREKIIESSSANEIIEIFKDQNER